MKIAKFSFEAIFGERSTHVFAVDGLALPRPQRTFERVLVLSLAAAIATIVLIAPIFLGGGSLGPSHVRLASQFQAMATYNTTLTFSPNAIFHGGHTTGVLAKATAPTTDINYTLSIPSGHPNNFPMHVKLLAGQKTASFVMTNLSEAATTDVVLPVTAIATNGDRASGSVNLLAPRNVVALDFDSDTATPGQPFGATVTLDIPSPAGGLAFTIKAANLPGSVPATVSVPAGQKTGHFVVQVAANAGYELASLTVGKNVLNGGTSLTSNIQISPPYLEDIWFTPSIVLAGSPTTGHVLLSGPAPAGGIKFLTAKVPGDPVTVASSTMVAAGSRTSTFAATALTPSGNISDWATMTVQGLGEISAASFWDSAKQPSMYPTEKGNPLDGTPPLRSAPLLGQIKSTINLLPNYYFFNRALLGANDEYVAGGVAYDVKTGKQLWLDPNNTVGKAVIGRDGSILGGSGAALFNIDPLKGRINWTHFDPAVTSFLPEFAGADGIVYGFKASGNALYVGASFALDTDGNPVADGTGIDKFIPLTQGEDRTLYGFTPSNPPQSLYDASSISAYGPANKLLWTKHVDGPLAVARKAGVDVLYVADGSGLRAYNHLGNQLWNSIDTSSYAYPQIVLGRDGTIYRLSQFGYLDAHSSTGHVLWESLFTGQAFAVSSYLGADKIYHDDLIIATDQNGFTNLVCLDGKSQTSRWTVSGIPGSLSALRVGLDGTPYLFTLVTINGINRIRMTTIK